jgi:hypothetical protein
MDRLNRHHLADRPPLRWTTHATAGGTVRTAVGRNGDVLVETYLRDRSHQSHGAVLAWRVVCIPAGVAREVVRGIAEQLEASE